MNLALFLEQTFPTAIDCWGPCGPIIIRSAVEKPVTSLERLWAYLTVKQLLEERDSAENPEELTRKAVQLALTYSFVTDVTSLVVVKPDETAPVLEDHVADVCKYLIFLKINSRINFLLE